MLEKHDVDREKGFDVLFDWLDEIFESKGQKLEYFLHCFKVLAVEDFYGLWQYFMQELTVDLVSHVLDQSDAEVDDIALDSFYFFVIEEMNQLLDDFGLVQDQERVAKAEAFDLSEDPDELRGMILELFCPQELNKVGRR